MKFKWNGLKNKRLKKTRGVSFEEVITSKIIGTEDHPVIKHQKLVLFYFQDYVWVAPAVEEGTYMFLKTLYPSRKYYRKHKKGELQ